ncbi:MAG: ATP-binding cassette domain-containing protein [Desulfobacteraceae bacterium]|nr:ATP-binding cassette domain-containing protein [Desulfobacteraceae bacterium]
MSKYISAYCAGLVRCCGANGSGKTTLLKLATGLLDPDEGCVDTPNTLVYCPQRTDNIPGRLDELIFEKTKPAHAIKSMLGIYDDWAERWETLSHGERKRTQIVVAFWLKPDVLTIDEP